MKRSTRVPLVSRDHQDKTWTVRYSSVRDPGSYYIYYPAENKAQFLFYSNSRFAAYSPCPLTPISFKAQDGLTIEGYLTLPQETPKNIPFIFFIHGGPWARDYWEFNPAVPMLANRGYGVMQVNFRGSTGYGKDFLNKGNKQWGKKMLDDILDAKKGLVDQKYADPGRVAIMGFSYGGYATLVALAFAPEEFVCDMTAIVLSNLFTLYNSFPPYWEPLKILLKKRLGDPQIYREYFKSISPLFSAENTREPLLIGQGENDIRLTKKESDQIVEALREKGQPVEYLLFADQGHDFLNPENRIRFFEGVDSFFNRYLSKKSGPSSLDKRL
ncbi:alpha/beta hydrolase family protein [Candidatus Methylacidiphilum infernorum]|uniref:alpha/beta hydrolase family protein n=1 Tax=Candidatus Methylacidiphilum infernorum TaxID=511746 RepID=UPI00164F2E67|nr:S9 family peptidase [Candidatus Methylacidiphilum infernorum]